MWYRVQGEIEAEGVFDEVSKLPLFSELLEEEEQPDAAPLARARKRTMSVQVGCFCRMSLSMYE